MPKSLLKIIIVLASMLCITFFILIITMYHDKKHNIEFKTDKETIYSLFYNFSDSKNIYYAYHNLYSKWSIGPTIYQIDILAELTEESYESFINEVKKSKIENLKMKFNPCNLTYNWRKVEDTTILQAKDIEDASVTEIYFDENNKTIYIIAIGGN